MRNCAILFLKNAYVYFIIKNKEHIRRFFIMKKIIAILMTLVLGLGFSAAAFAVEGEGEEPLLIQNVEMVENDGVVLDEELEEEVAEEEVEEEEEEGESFWNQNTIVIFLVAFVAIVVILNLMQLR